MTCAWSGTRRDRRGAHAAPQDEFTPFRIVVTLPAKFAVARAPRDDKAAAIA